MGEWMNTWVYVGVHACGRAAGHSAVPGVWPTPTSALGCSRCLAHAHIGNRLFPVSWPTPTSPATTLGPACTMELMLASLDRPELCDAITATRDQVDGSRALGNSCLNRATHPCIATRVLQVSCIAAQILC